MKTLKILLAAITTLWMVSCGSGDPTEDVPTNTVSEKYKEFDFARNSNTIYGFDRVNSDDPLYDGENCDDCEAHSPDSRDSVYMSIEQNQTDVVDVIVGGSATTTGYESFYVTSSDPSVVSIDSGSNRLSVPENARTPVTLTAGNIGNIHSRVQIKLMGVSSALESEVSLQTLYVEVFKKKEVTINYYRVYDSRSFGTNVTFKPTKEEVEPILADILRQAVVEVKKLRFEEFDIPYDGNGNGVLDVWFDGNENVETLVIRDIINTKSQQEPGYNENVAHIQNAHGVWTIINAIAKGANVTLNVKSTTTLRSWNPLVDIYIGNERVTIKNGSATDTTVEINRLNNNYPAGSLLWFSLGGVSPSEKDIAFVVSEHIPLYTNKLPSFVSVVVHELCHGPFANYLNDVYEEGNVMNYSTLDLKSYVLRMRPIQGTHTSTYWPNGKSPQKQWLRLQNLEQ